MNPQDQHFIHCAKNYIRSRYPQVKKILLFPTQQSLSDWECYGCPAPDVLKWGTVEPRFLILDVTAELSNQKIFEEMGDAEVAVRWVCVVATAIPSGWGGVDALYPGGDTDGMECRWFHPTARMIVDRVSQIATPVLSRREKLRTTMRELEMARDAIDKAMEAVSSVSRSFE